MLADYIDEYGEIEPDEKAINDAAKKIRTVCFVNVSTNRYTGTTDSVCIPLLHNNRHITVSYLT